MNKNLTISKLQFSILFLFPILTVFNCISFSDILDLGGFNACICIMFSFLMGMIPIVLFLYIFNYKPLLSIADKNIFLFGKYIGTIMNYILVFIFGAVGIIILYSTSNFIIIHYLKDVPRIIILFVIGFVVFYGVIHGIEVIARISFVFAILILVLSICSTMGLVTKFDISSFYPISYVDFKNIVFYGIQFVFYNIIPIFILLIIPKNYIKDNNKVTRWIIGSYLMGMVFIFII